MATPIWCRRCGQRTTPAEREAVWDAANSGWRAEHAGDCPPSQHLPDGRPTWSTWEMGAREVPRGFRPGRVLTLSWPENDAAAAEVPDRVVTRPWAASATETATAEVLVVQVHQIAYDRDGLSFGADSDSGSVYWAVVCAPAGVVAT